MGTQAEMVLFRSTPRAEAFAECAFAVAARRPLVRPFAVVGRLLAEPGDIVELHRSAASGVLEALRLSVDEALATWSFTHGAILYKGVGAPEAAETVLVADVLERGRSSVMRFIARGSAVELVGAVPSTDWP